MASAAHRSYRVRGDAALEGRRRCSPARCHGPGWRARREGADVGVQGGVDLGQALAVLREREYVLPDDIKYLAKPVLTHRVILAEEERLRGETPEHVIDEIVSRVRVPIGSE